MWPEKGAWLLYEPHFLDAKAADAYLAQMLERKNDFHDEQSFYGNPPARQVKWYGDFKYVYSRTSVHEVGPRRRLYQRSCLDGA